MDDQALEADEKQLIHDLGGCTEAEDFAPEVEDTSEKQQKLASAVAHADMGLSVLESVIQGFCPAFAFDPDQKNNAAAKVAPCLVKYNGELPPWLAPYVEEISAAVALGTLGFTSYKGIKEQQRLANAKQVEAVQND